MKQAGGPGTHTANGKKFTHRTYCIRCADDFVVLHNTWEGIQRCKEAIQEWLKGMGLELKDAKTRFAHTLEAKEECNGNVGFNFLGFTIRQFPVGLRSPHRPLSATEDGDQSRRMPYLSEAWTFWPRQEATGVADAMIKAVSCLLFFLSAFSPSIDTIIDRDHNRG